MSESDAIIHVRDLEKHYRVWSHAPPTNLKERLHVAGVSLRARLGLGDRQVFRQDVWALRGVSFDVRRGEVLGVIGRNGAGKSTLLSILARITEPTGGFAEIRGRVNSLLEVGTGFHPELTGRDNVFLNGAILGMARDEIARKFDEIVDFSGVRDFIDIPVKRYSSGMQVRLAFAVGAHLDPEILLLDEVLAVGDTAFQAKCHSRVQEMAESGRTVLFVTHDVTSMMRLCHRAIVLDDGRISFEGPAEKAVEHYLVGDGARAGEQRRSDTAGPVSIRSVEVGNLDGEASVSTGEPLQIVVELDAREPVRLDELRVELAVLHPAGAEFVRLSTHIAGRTRLTSQTISGSGALVCAVEGLPLRPGAYIIAAVLHRNDEMVDRIEHAADLTLVSGSLLDSGAMPAGSTAPVLVRHDWTLEGTAPSTSGAQRSTVAATPR